MPGRSKLCSRPGQETVPCLVMARYTDALSQTARKGTRLRQDAYVVVTDHARRKVQSARSLPNHH